MHLLLIILVVVVVAVILATEMPLCIKTEKLKYIRPFYVVVVVLLLYWTAETKWLRSLRCFSDLLNHFSSL